MVKDELARFAAPLAWGACLVLMLGGRPAFGAAGDGRPGVGPPGADMAAAAPAGAPSPVDWELAAVAEYVAPPIRGGTNPFGFGFGGRFGLTISQVYVGLSVVDYLGGNDVNLSDQALLFGGDVGYGFVLHRFDAKVSLVLRPIVGVGDAEVSHTDPALMQTTQPDVVTTASGRVVARGGGTSDTTTIDTLYVRPSVAMMLSGGWHFIALEGSVLVLPGIAYGGADPSTWITYGARLQLGVRF